MTELASEGEKLLNVISSPGFNLDVDKSSYFVEALFIFWFGG